MLTANRNSRNTGNEPLRSRQVETVTHCGMPKAPKKPSQKKSQAPSGPRPAVRVRVIPIDEVPIPKPQKPKSSDSASKGRFG